MPLLPETALNIVLTDAPPPHAHEVLFAGLIAYNQAKAGMGDWRPLAVLVLDEAGVAAGGLWGSTAYGWLSIELVFIPEALRRRGLATELLSRAEAEARERGCRGAWLDTFEFQGFYFYQRLGYVACGQIEDFPTGFSRYFMKKML